MADEFNKRGIKSAVLVGETDDESRTRLVQELRAGKLAFIFAHDVLNEGLDVPEVNTVLFLRPTESLTVFLQQLGRGLRHSPEKDCLTVLDFVGQVHRRYRIDRKLKSLLSKKRLPIDREVELNFPHLPSGCSIQLDRLAREYVLANIRENLRQLSEQVVERLETFEQESGQKLTFANFIRFHDYDPSTLLSKDTWTGWRVRARLIAEPKDPDRQRLQSGLIRVAQANGPRELNILRAVSARLRQQDVDGALDAAGESALRVHYRLWGRPGTQLGFGTLRESFDSLSRNPEFLADLTEILDWAEAESRIGGQEVNLPFPCALELHAQYSGDDLKAALGLANIETAGVRGVGLLHSRERKTYAVLVTFQKTEREFSPSTMYADYPISREMLHWESPSNTTQTSEAGRNLINHEQAGYTVLFFARATKREEGRAVPFTYLGPGMRVSYQNERPIQMVWRLRYPMPAEMFEDNRRGG